MFDILRSCGQQELPPAQNSVSAAATVLKQKAAAELGAQGLTLRNLSSFSDYLEIEKMKLGMVVEA